MPIALADKKTTLESSGFRLTGGKVLLILLGFFVTVASVNAVMIYSAISSFRGEVVDRPYERGLAYNNDIAAARAQAERGWRVDAALARGLDGQERIEVSARDSKNAPITGLEISAVLETPVEKKGDLSLKFEEVGGGLYRASGLAGRGERVLVLTASRNGERLFLSRNRVNLN